MTFQRVRARVVCVRVFTGGGARKCIGDQFALMEATIALAVLLRRFNFSLAVPPEKVRAKDGLGISVGVEQG
mgnify:CR=1 FL=1